MGVSGGEEGARHGPSLMPGGSFEAYKHIENILLKVVAQVPDSGPCVTYIGKGGSGNFVKMAHNERMKKRLQFQARKASLGGYYRYGSASTSWFFDPESTLHEESQISFSPYEDSGHLINGSQISKWYAVPADQVPFQQDTHTKFTFSHAEGSRDEPSPFLASKEACKSLDLQLGLSLKTNFQSSSGTGI